MNTIEKTADLVGRVLISMLFLGAGFDKIGGYAGTQAYMESVGVPGALLPLVIALEIAGGFLFLVARGAGDWSLDARRTRLASPGVSISRP
jgi:uncharacterized membrane protein YphA (DoxX/SURF4 family)